MPAPHPGTTARQTWRTLEPVHGLVYFAPEQTEQYGRLGLHGRSGYFASRSAPLGPVPPAVVVATFYNFEPALVGSALDGVWTHTTPAEVLAARLDVARVALERVLGDEAHGPEVTDAALLARRAADVACEHPEGRPLFAAHTSLPWPDDDLLVLWHAQTLLREFRGDGHITALVDHGLSGCEALVVHAATGEVGADVLRTTRSWSVEAWQEATERLQARGWLDAMGGLTARGQAEHDEIERRTDRLASGPYDALGPDRCQRLRALVRPRSRLIVSAGFGAQSSRST